jgi:hypothetical protein
MWILTFLPDVAFHIITFVGIVGLFTSYFLGIFPLLSRYKLPVQIASICLLVAGIYFEGMISNEAKWETRVKQMEAKALIAEAKAKSANSQIEVRYVDRVQTVTDVQYVVQERIREVEKLIDKECKITPEALDILNTAADNRIPGDGQ